MIRYQNSSEAAKRLANEVKVYPKILKLYQVNIPLYSGRQIKETLKKL